MKQSADVAGVIQPMAPMPGDTDPAASCVKKLGAENCKKNAIFRQQN